jgi:tetratricopeptide (TPR) repeat protein
MPRNSFLLLVLCMKVVTAATPQAATRDELDVFGRAYEASDPLEQIRACESFLARYPGSEFREKALEVEFNAFEQRGDRAAAERVGERILALDGRNARILAELARLEMVADSAHAAKHAAESLSVLRDMHRPDDMDRSSWVAWKRNTAASVESTLGILALRDQKFAEAAAHFRQSLSIHPETAEWQHDLGLALFQQGRLEDAIAAFREAHRLKPDLRGTLVFLGIAELRLGKFREASADSRAAVALEPGQRDAWLNLLRANQALAEFDEEMANRARDLFPDDGEIQFTIAQCALDRIRQIAKRVNESGPENENFRALMDRSRGKDSPAVPSPLIASWDRLAGLVGRCFESVLRVSGDSPSAHIAKGYLEEAQNHVETALAEYRAGGDSFAAGRLLAQNSRLPEAEQEFQKDLEKNPSNHLTMADLAEVYVQLDEIEKARQILESLLRMYPADALGWLDLGKAQQRQRDWSAAAASFQKALSIDPSLSQAHYHLSIVYRNSGQSEKATSELNAFRNTARKVVSAQ